MSVRQPWASALLADDANRKDIENRGWSTSHRGRLYIHAAKTHDEDAHLSYELLDLPMHYGVVLGYVDLVDVVRDSPSRWAEPYAYHWVTANPVRLARPIDLRGMPGLFSCDPRLLDLEVAGAASEETLPLF
ncbi:ASCH domain-containing protein [Nonomuraea sp. NPDC050556]|uniref:ASCH domain-containing protein n=1 Tax=Nonomuraea sp. NPDC050556 TaxID=3364369 RepID=UPI0037B1DB5D